MEMSDLERHTFSRHLRMLSVRNIRILKSYIRLPIDSFLTMSLVSKVDLSISFVRSTVRLMFLLLMMYSSLLGRNQLKKNSIIFLIFFMNQESRLFSHEIVRQESLQSLSHDFRVDLSGEL